MILSIDGHLISFLVVQIYLFAESIGNSIAESSKIMILETFWNKNMNSTRSNIKQNSNFAISSSMYQFQKTINFHLPWFIQRPEWWRIHLESNELKIALLALFFIQ